MIDLLQNVETRLKELFAAEQFDDPSGGTSIPQIKIGGLDAKRSGQQNTEDFPFIVILPSKGSGDRRGEDFAVDIQAGVWSVGSVLDGMIAVDRACELILNLQRHRIFTPYNMSLPITWQYGGQHGQQPHPYYYVTVTVLFKRAPQA